MARTSLLTVLLLCALALPAFGQDEEEYDPDYGRTGAYVSIQAKAAFTRSDWKLPLVKDLDWQADAGMDVRIGWRETPLWSIEAEFEWIPNHNGIEFGTWTLGANAKWYAMLMEDRLQPYLVLGANGTFVRQPDLPNYRVDWGFRNGIGMDYYLTGNWAITAESTFVWGVGEIWGYYYVTAGIGAMYRF